MYKVITVPRLDVNSDTATVCTIMVKENDHVQAGTILATIETLKSVFDIPALEEGYIRKILVSCGTEIPVSTPLIIMSTTADEEIPDIGKDGTDGLPGLPGAAQYAVSLKAQKLAAELNVDTSGIIPADGKTVKQTDIYDYAKKQETVPCTEREILPFEREIIRTLMFSKNEAVCSYLERSIDVSPLVEYAEKYKKENTLIFNPFIALLCWYFVQVIGEQPGLNTTIKNNKMILYQPVNLGFTVEIKNLLYLVTIKNCLELTQLDFINRFFSLQRKANKGTLTPGELTGYTVGFTSLAAKQINRHIPLLPSYTSVMLAHSVHSPQGPDNRFYTNLGVTYDHRIHTGFCIANMLDVLNRKITGLAI